MVPVTGARPGSFSLLQAVPNAMCAIASARRPITRRRLMVPPQAKGAVKEDRLAKLVRGQSSDSIVADRIAIVAATEAGIDAVVRCMSRVPRYMDIAGACACCEGINLELDVVANVAN